MDSERMRTVQRACTKRARAREIRGMTVENGVDAGSVVYGDNGDEGGRRNADDNGEFVRVLHLPSTLQI